MLSTAQLLFALSYAAQQRFLAHCYLRQNSYVLQNSYLRHNRYLRHESGLRLNKYLLHNIHLRHISYLQHDSYLWHNTYLQHNWYLWHNRYFRHKNGLRVDNYLRHNEGMFGVAVICNTSVICGTTCTCCTVYSAHRCLRSSRRCARQLRLYFTTAVFSEKDTLHMMSFRKKSIFGIWIHIQKLHTVIGFKTGRGSESIYGNQNPTYRNIDTEPVTVLVEILYC